MQKLSYWVTTTTKGSRKIGSQCGYETLERAKEVKRDLDRAAREEGRNDVTMICYSDSPPLR